MSIITYPMYLGFWLVRWIFLQLQIIPHWTGSFFSWFLRNFVVWVSAPEFKYLLRGAPAILLMLIAFYTAGICLSRSDDILANTYLDRAGNAETSNNPTLASMLYERVIQIQGASGTSDKTLFQLALNLGKIGKIERSSFILESLSPEEKHRYAPAHILKAQSYLSSPNLSPITFEKAKIQLVNAIKASPIDDHTRLLLADLYMNEGNFNSAEELYLMMEKNQPSARLSLAKIYLRKGKIKESKELALTVKDELELLDSLNKKSESVAIVYADALTFLGEFNKALEALNQVYVLKKKPEIKSAITQIMITWSDDIIAKDPEKIKDAYFVLTRALEFQPDNLLIFDRMMKVLGRKDKLSEEARKMLLDCATRGETQAMAHTLLGTDYGENNDIENAIRHLRLAFEFSPQSVIIVNNLAWYLAMKDPPEYAHALDLVNKALKESRSYSVQLLDTRGMINLKMGKFESAVSDFERALPSLDSDPGIHERLSEAYGKLGNKELSNLHAERAELLQKQAESQKAKP